MATPAVKAFDFAGLKRAIEHSDADALIRLYADDAEMVVIDRDRPPSSPMTLTGRDAIAAFWRDVCSRAMTHHIDHEVVGDGRISYIEECAYPDGCHVTAAMTLDLRGDRIARHLTVQAWDEVSGAKA